MVSINVSQGDALENDSSALVIHVFEGITKPDGILSTIDSLLSGVVNSLIKDGEFTGKSTEIVRFPTLGKIKPTRVVLSGLGKKESINSLKIKEKSAEVARYLRNIGVTNISIALLSESDTGIPEESFGQSVAMGSTMGLYQFKKYKSPKANNPEKSVESISIISPTGSSLSDLKRGVEKGILLSNAVEITRNLVNEPANVVTPSQMANIASETANAAGLPITILEKDDMVKHKMGAMLGVTAGSAQPPKLILIEHKGDPENPDNNIALVGKGITFDTGGISLKQAAGMGDMKGDMSGGASVIGAMHAIGTIKPKINVLGVIPAVENMPGSNAQRPGDIVTAMNGKTIEVENTDAEGRLVLADAISYIIQEKGTKRVVDIATLTGAMVVALGHVTTGVFGKTQSLVDEVLKASKTVGEKMWQLPIFDEYKEQNRSDWADVKNTGGRPAGSITAALFIGEFTDGADWAHLDIAGTNMASKAKGHIVKGATGVPVLSLVQLVENLAEAT